MIGDIAHFERQNIGLRGEIEELKSTLNRELTKEQPNIKEITD